MTPIFWLVSQHDTYAQLYERDESSSLLLHRDDHIRYLIKYVRSQKYPLGSHIARRSSLDARQPDWRNPPSIRGRILF